MICSSGPTGKLLDFGGDKDITQTKLWLSQLMFYLSQWNLSIIVLSRGTMIGTSISQIHMISGI